MCRLAQLRPSASDFFFPLRRAEELQRLAELARCVDSNESGSRFLLMAVSNGWSKDRCLGWFGWSTSGIQRTNVKIAVNEWNHDSDLEF